MTDPTYSDLRRALSTGRPGTVPWWVTREVLESGSVLGAPLTGGPLEPDEVALSRSLGMGASRWAILRHDLTEEAMEQMYAALAAGRYAVRHREDAAVLVVAWLLRKGKRHTALDVVTALGPVADEVRLGPRLTTAPVVPAGSAFRWTAGPAREKLAASAPTGDVLAQTETLTVWNPMSDQIVELWLDVIADRGDVVTLPNVWRKRAQGVVEEFEDLVRTYTRCGRARRRSSGLAIMVRHLRLAANRGRLTARQWDTVVRVVDGTVARRGVPGSPEHGRRRAEELRASAPPTRVAVAHLVAQRLSDHCDVEGILDVEAVLAPVTSDEARTSGVPAGTPVPVSVRRIVERARAARPEDLQAAGVVSSGQALAEMTPQLAASATAAGSDADPVLATLMSACWRAHERYISTLAPGLRAKERFEELPWVTALDWRPSRPAQERGLRVVHQIAGLALDSFPGMVMPESLVLALRRVLEDAGVASLLLAEVHPRHVKDRLPERYRASAQLTAQMLGDSVYGRYFDIDPDVVARLRPEGVVPGGIARHVPWLRHRPRLSMTDLCRQRAEVSALATSAPEVRAVIEQAHILTADQVPALLQLGVRPSVSWEVLARQAFDVVCAQVSRSRDRRIGPRARSRAHRRAEVAWRQMVLDLALSDEGKQEAVLDGIRETLGRHDRAVGSWVTPNLRSLEHVVAGGRLSPGGA